MRKKHLLLVMLVAMVMCITSCGTDKIESWNVEDYEQLEDIIRIDEAENDESTEVFTYKIRYKSDECEVIAYLSIPEKCLENEEAPEEYEKRSATYWADKIKCPVLIIHSELDERVSYAQAEKMDQCLEEAGKEYKFISYEDDVHGFHPEDLDIILDWCQ